MPPKSWSPNARPRRGGVQGTFNDIVLVADKNSTAESIVAHFTAERERRAEAYRSSPEGKKAARESEERTRRLQQKCDDLLQKLHTLDFTSDVAVLDWLCEFQDPSDHIGVESRPEAVVAVFRSRGFYPNVNCGDDFNADDRDNFARWIIGQALDGLAGNVGAIHQIIHKFADDWKKKFLSAAA